MGQLCCGLPTKTLFDSSRSPLALTDEIFKKYDKNGNGELDARELRSLFGDAFPGQTISLEHLNLLTKSLDLDLSGAVGVNELRAFLRCYNPATRQMRRRNALVIIDVQNDYISGALPNHHNPLEVVPLLNRLRSHFDVVVVSGDWHPEEHCSFVESVNAGLVPIDDEMREFEAFERVTLKGDADRKAHQQMLFPRHAVAGTPGAAHHPDLVIKDSDKIVHCGTRANVDSYSAFFDNMKVFDTGLAATLELDQVTDIFCCGLGLDLCVLTSALHGAELGFRTVVIEDASKPTTLDSVEPVCRQLREAGVAVMTSQEAIQTLNVNQDLTLSEYLALIKLARSAKRVHASIMEQRGSCTHEA